jgi:hypothetical protein
MKKQYRDTNGFIDIVESDELLEGFTEYSDEAKPQVVTDRLAELNNVANIQKQVMERKEFLKKTDNREFPSYICKDGEILEDTIAKRVEAREFIRANT